jgi:uncharacterized cupredoxin-like copper-binding protein
MQLAIRRPIPAQQQESSMFNRNAAIHSMIPVILAAALALPAQADATVKVTLWDKGGMMDMSHSMGMGMGMHADMKMAMMGLDVDQGSVAAGEVTFEAINSSKETIHEMIVAPIASEDVVMPYNVNENRVDEDASGSLGEVEELDPGKSGKVTLTLKSGLYLLYCNIPGHFMAGMWKVLKVE